MHVTTTYTTSLTKYQYVSPPIGKVDITTYFEALPAFQDLYSTFKDQTYFSVGTRVLKMATQCLQYHEKRYFRILPCAILGLSQQYWWQVYAINRLMYGSFVWSGKKTQGIFLSSLPVL